MTRKRRTLDDLRRRHPFVHPRESVLIVCEGRETEPQYFDALRNELRLRKLVEVNVASRHDDSEPISVVNYAISLKTERAKTALTSPILTTYDVVWCVIDVEVNQQRPTLSDALNKAREHKIKVALSNPSIEYWFLLHFVKITTPFSSNEALQSELRKVHSTYRKSNIGFHILYQSTDIAIKNSEEVLKETGCGEDLTAHNPSTHVHRIVKHLQQIATRPVTLRK